VLWIKYEFWYYYLHELKARKTPVLLVSGSFRKTQPFFKRYGAFWKQMLNCFEHCFVQNQNSKNLLEEINIKNVTVSGDTRFDRVIAIAEKFIDVDLIKVFCDDAKVIVAGSTWKEDEAVLVHFVKNNPQVKFIIAPHEISKENLKDVKKQFPNSLFYSEWILSINANKQPAIDISQTTNYKLQTTNCLIIDNIGMLSRLYKYADITYVGGGFSDGGLHNILEAAVYGKPVIFGPEFEKNFEADELIECEGGITIENALELETILNTLINDKEELKERSIAAKNYVYNNAGATEKIMGYIQEKRLLTN
jgi:3-deoxy-D-manno-octulosonic-acid transferase